MNITVDEARILKVEAEQAITDILNTLIEATGRQVNGLTFEFSDSTSSPPHAVMYLELELQIK